MSVFPKITKTFRNKNEKNHSAILCPSEFHVKSKAPQKDMKSRLRDHAFWSWQVASDWRITKLLFISFSDTLDFS